jgi:low affinity Fe/Cu permease
MVFAIQTSQNRETTAMNIKLDELIRAQPAARNRLMAEEAATEKEIEGDERAMLRRADDGRRRRRKKPPSSRSPS